MHPILAKVTSVAWDHPRWTGAALGSAVGVASSVAQTAVDGLGGMDLKRLTDLGVTVALVWFLYYTVAVRDPKREEQHRREIAERDERHRQELAERDRLYREESDRRERKQNEEMREQRQDYLASLGSIGDRNAREREDFRRTMERMAGSVDGVVEKVRDAVGGVADMERLHAEALLKLSHNLDRDEQKRKESDGGGNPQ